MCFVMKYMPLPAAVTRTKEVIILPTFYGYVKGATDIQSP